MDEIVDLSQASEMIYNLQTEVNDAEQRISSLEYELTELKNRIGAQLDLG